MVTIRLSRGGSKKKPFYHIDVKDSRTRRDGRYIERLGFFNPVAQGNAESIRINMERADYWLGVGAQTSENVKKLIKQYRKSVKAAVANPEVDTAAVVAATTAATEKEVVSTKTPPAEIPEAKADGAASDADNSGQN